MNDRQPGASSGAVLLEALVAVAILGTIGSATAWNAAEWIRAVHRAHREEDQVRAASRMLTAVSLWPRADLDLHLGKTAQGSWNMWVERTRPSLYEISIADTATGVALVRTVLFRKEAEQ